MIVLGVLAVLGCQRDWVIFARGSEVYSHEWEVVLLIQIIAFLGVLALLGIEGCWLCNLHCSREQAEGVLLIQ